MAGKGGTTARAVGNDLEALVQQALLPDLLQRPPLGLDVVVIVCDKRMLHVSPETYGAGEILPHALVFPDALFTFADERIQAVLLDLLLAVQTQHLLDLQLYRKSVGIPAGLSRYHVALHGAVSGDHILDNTGQHMADMGFTIGGRRSVVEGVGLAFLAAVHALLENVIFIPELFNLFLTADEIQVG